MEKIENLISEENYTEAINELVEKLETEKEMTIPWAEAAFLYSKCLLAYSQESATKVITTTLVQQITKKKIEEETGEAQEPVDVDPMSLTLEDVDDNMENCWELGTLCQEVYEKEFDKDPQNYGFRLSEIHLLLGDLLAEGDSFTEALKEYTQSLTYLQKLPKRDYKQESAVYIQEAICNLISNDAEAGLKSYQNAAEALEAFCKLHSDSCESEKKLLDSIKERIEDIKVQAKEEEKKD